MPDISSNHPHRKVLILAAVAITAAVLGSSGILYYLGVFDQVTVQKFTTPGYQIAHLTHIGPYDKIQETIDQVAEMLDPTIRSAATPCALLLDDPSVVAKTKLRSKVGYLIKQTDYIPDSLALEQLTPIEVAQVFFKGSPVIGSYKAYAAMKQWSAYRGYVLHLPALEIYHQDGVIEYQLPISKKTRSLSDLGNRPG